MPPVVTTAKIVCNDGASRDKALSQFHVIATYSYRNEPDVRRYIISIPLDDTNTTDIWMIEEYASTEAQAAHIATSPVEALINLFTTSDVLVSAPEVHDLPLAFHKSCPDISLESNPAVLLSWFEYDVGKSEHALDGWKYLVDYVSSKEEGTGGYAVVGGGEGGKVRTVEFYDSWQYWEDVHLKSPTFKSMEKQNDEDASEHGAVKVKVVGGFLGRG